MIVSASIAMKLVTMSTNLLRSLELDRNVTVHATQDVPKIGINLVGPLYLPRHYRLLYYPLFILWQHLVPLLVGQRRWPWQLVLASHQP